MLHLRPTLKSQELFTDGKLGRHVADDGVNIGLRVVPQVQGSSLYESAWEIRIPSYKVFYFIHLE
jgi:hypothetical protein